MDLNLFRNNVAIVLPQFSGLVGWALAGGGYWLIFIVAVLEGPILGVISGLLIRLNYFHFWSIYLILMAGDLTGDVIWYQIGRHGVRRFIDRFGHFIGLDAKNIATIERVFRKHETKTLLISKMTSGFGFSLLTLMTAGSIGVPFKKYVFINFIGQFVWSGILLTVGYFFGQFYETINRDFRLAALVILILIVLAALYGVKKYARSVIT